MECSICLQNFVHPVKLPCGHIFCFLCIKGCAFHRRRCPVCRGRFSIRFFDDPQLISGTELSSGEVTSEQATTSVPTASTKSSSYRWFYEGYGGWWQYDERTSDELEEAFSSNVPSLDITVAGYVYTIDFRGMSQMRKDRSGRRRRIKRDLSTCEKKGIAGIKLTSLNPSSSQSETSSVSGDGSVSSQASNGLGTTVDLHTDQVTVSPSGDSQSRPTFQRSRSSRASTDAVLSTANVGIVATTTSVNTRSRSRQNQNPVTTTRSSRSLSRSNLRPNQ